ncbi:hypothetical protein [Antarctobacter sp.]|uniref:hypothetical protein n=1 Tax=Antarctobacter sp. TaxID=1872577 RepID=UPI003A8E4CD6
MPEGMFDYAIVAEQRETSCSAVDLIKAAFERVAEDGRSTERLRRIAQDYAGQLASEQLDCAERLRKLQQERQLRQAEESTAFMDWYAEVLCDSGPCD